MKRKLIQEDDHYRGWIEFNNWCDEQGIGTAQEDWEIFWQCWLGGYFFASNLN